MSFDKGKYHTPKEEREGNILSNKLGIEDPQNIGRAETRGFIKAETLLLEELTNETVFDHKYICDIHRRALHHLYEFAGDYRSVNMSKKGFIFPAAKYVPQAMKHFENEYLLNMTPEYHSKDKLIIDIGTVHAELLYWNCNKKIDSGLSHIMQPVLGFVLNNAAFPPVFDNQA